MTHSDPDFATLRTRKHLSRRAAMLRLQTLSAEECRRRSSQICDRLAQWKPLTVANTVLLFAPMATVRIPEVDLTDLARACLARGGPRICVPRLDWSSRRLVPALVTDWDRELVVGRYDVREPAPACPTLDPGLLDLVLVPGLAFDEYGRRLGRGGGFYDRFLATPNLRARAVGVCFDRQILPPTTPPLPTHDHDARMHAVITESRVIEL